MNPARVSIGSIRKSEIIEAAVAIIADRGIQHLSLSGIETRTGMSRGQLTYYFRTKEEILLAVFDRLIDLLHQRTSEGWSGKPEAAQMIGHLLGTVMEGPRAHPEFHALQYTFLSQIWHRKDFRGRLARLYEDWRTGMAEPLADEGSSSPASCRTIASLVQAILHGLAIQLAADPAAFDRKEMRELCLQVLGSYLRTPEQKSGRASNGATARAKKKTGKNGSTGRGGLRRPPNRQRVKHG